MQLLNATKFKAGFTQGLKPDGRELLVVVIKGTFEIPSTPQEDAPLAKEQLDLVESDEFLGEPGFSAPRYESDFAPFKPRCDVVLDASAYAPANQRATKVSVGVKIGEVSKVFDVIGDRKWEAGIGGVGAGFAQPFERKKISYDVAFGGTDRFSSDPDKHDAFMRNPSGVGYRKGLTTGQLNDTQMPNTQQRDKPISNPLGDYAPMSLGPVARAWFPRCQHAGTYDDGWLENVFPFLPDDFDDRYFQCAPDDQQTGYLQGGESVVLVNLTPDQRCEFRVPEVTLPVHFFLEDGQQVERAPVADTLFIEPDEGRFSVCWRTHLPLKRNIFEVQQALVGTMPRSWWRARAQGKSYYRGLGAVVKSRGAVGRQG